MAYLTRNALNAIAERIVTKYYTLNGNTMDMCRVDPKQIATQILGRTIDHVQLSADHSVLCVTSYGEISLIILNDSTETIYTLDGKTILIEKSLCTEDQRGRYNFTLAYELSHQILKMLYPKEYGVRRKKSKPIFYRAKKDEITR